MPDERLKKYLNDIVWWIPNRKLRDVIRETFSILYEIKEQNNILLKINNNTNNIQFIVIECGGGFVDQLYLYRFGYSIEKLYNKKVLYDISWYNRSGKSGDGKYNRNFELKNIFDDFSFREATNNEIQIAKKFFISGLVYENIDITNIIENNKFLYLDMDCSWRTYNKQLNFNEVFDLDKYIFSKLNDDNKNILYDIKNNKYSVGCHIRRNDYLIVDYRIFNLDEYYYIRAIEKISEQVKEKLKIYFFSDDMDWVKNKLIPLVKDKYDYLAVDINDNDR